MLLLLVAALQLVEAALQPQFCYYLSSELAPPATPGPNNEHCVHRLAVLINLHPALIESY